MKTSMLLKPSQRFYSITEILAAGLTYYRIKRLVDEGCLTKLNNKIYENMSYEGEESDFALVSVYAPKGVVCMMSAARFYGLTTFLPEAVDIAIEHEDFNTPELAADKCVVFPRETLQCRDDISHRWCV